MTRRLASRIALALCFVLPPLAEAAEPAKASTTIESLLQDLKSRGIDIIYNSYLVSPDLVASEAGVPESAPAMARLDAARQALAAYGLELREFGPNRYVVARKTEAPAPEAEPREEMQEVSVYASRYAIAGRSLAEAKSMGSPEIEAIPGSHDDALRALKALPGLATSVSAKPYIRGSLSEDVLVRYDGITLLDPYHLKNFQSLFSAIDPAAVDDLEVFSGGFPVNYGTRSGGVINISAPSANSGYENRVSASLISAGVSSMGAAENMPLEWFGALRRSMLDLLEPVEEGFGKPQFSDSLGRSRWKTENGAYTAGWLLLDDELDFDDDGESAAAGYRDEYFWLARDHEFSDSLRTRVATVFTAAERERTGAVNLPGVVSGTLAESQEFERFEITNDWTYEASDSSSYSFGAELSISDSKYRHVREVTFDPAIAAAFGRAPVDSLDFSVRPGVVYYSLYASNRRSWADFEAEVGLRMDAQDYEGLGQHSQMSPRLNLRYDFTDRMRFYASIGRFTQAQHIEEWRVEEAQVRSDPAQSAIHSIIGVTHEAADLTWSVEAYSKRWTRVSPYFDNLLNPLSLLPELAPDRVRVAPNASEATGLEFSLRAPLAERWSGWGSASWSRVADDFGNGDVLRSWDQSAAISAGVSWEGSRLKLSMLGGWHRGWPRTPYVFSGPLWIGKRNSGRWPDYYTLDMRGAWTWDVRGGELETTLELTNATNRSNACCAAFDGPAGVPPRLVRDDWLPLVANLGFVFRWQRD